MIMLPTLIYQNFTETLTSATADSLLNCDGLYCYFEDNSSCDNIRQNLKDLQFYLGEMYYILTPEGYTYYDSSSKRCII